MSSILKKLHSENDKTLFDIHVELIQERFPANTSFRHRQGYVIVLMLSSDYIYIIIIIIIKLYWV